MMYISLSKPALVPTPFVGVYQNYCSSLGVQSYSRWSYTDRYARVYVFTDVHTSNPLTISSMKALVDNYEGPFVRKRLKINYYHRHGEGVFSS